MSNHLVIGLGGTGGAVLRSLRKRIYQEFSSNDPTRGDAHIDYLYVDSSLSDLNNEEDWQTLGASVQLAPAQRLSIHGIGSGVLDHLDEYPGINSFINRQDEAMLKEGVGAIISEGIGGQRRRFGRMLMANNLCGPTQESFIGRVHSRVRALKDKENVEDVTFHICAGLGGGTGSGSIVDAVAQIRNEFRRTGGDNEKFKIQLYLYVPEKIIQIPGGENSNRFYQPNGYAALLELNAMSVGKYRPTDVRGNTDEYGNVCRLLEGQEPFDMAYLYTNVNEKGKSLDIHDMLPDIVGDFLFQRIVAASVSSDSKMQRLLENENNGLLPEENESKEPVHGRRFMTFGIKRIEYPETEVVEYGAYNFARQCSMQMMYGLWDDARGYIECTEDMVGKDFSHRVARPDELAANLLDESHLMLDTPLPSIEKVVQNWDPIVAGWEAYTGQFQRLIIQFYPDHNREWIHKFKEFAIPFYNGDVSENGCYRDKGVKKFYDDSEKEIPGYAEEICRNIENRLFAFWKNGEMSILEIHKYLTELIKSFDERKKGFIKIKTDKNAYSKGELQTRIDEVELEYDKIGWMKDKLTHACQKKFNEYVDLKTKQFITDTQVYGYGYADKLLSEVATLLTVLKVNVIEPFMKVLKEFAVIMNNQASKKCKLSDLEEADMKNEVVKEYDPKMVQDTVVGFLRVRATQQSYAAALRTAIIDHVGTFTYGGFSDLMKEINVSTLQKIAVQACLEYAKRDFEAYSTKHVNQRLVNVNILDKLKHTECSTDEKRKLFIKNIYDAAQCFLPVNKDQGNKGSKETAAIHGKFIQLCLPSYEGGEEFRNEFINDFALTCENEDFRQSKDVCINFKNNQIVVITAHSGFPLRYVDNLKVLKEKYDILTRSEVKKMVVHTESFFKPLPSLYNKTNEDNKKELLPYIMLAYSMDGVLVQKEDPEKGRKYLAFGIKDEYLGRVGRWVEVGTDMVDTLNELSKVTRALDTVELKKLIVEELDTNYKHIEKKKQLMRQMGKTLDEVLLPLVGGNENHPIFVAFNRAAENLCHDELNVR